MILVHRLAKVPSLLLVPPVGMGVAELALDAGRVDVAAVLREIVSPPTVGSFACSSTHHLGILLRSERGIIRVGIFLFDSALADYGLGEEGSLLDNGESARGGERNRAEGRRPHDLA